MILRKDFVKLIRDGKAQVEVEKTEEHNEMLNLIFPKRVTIGIGNATELSKYYSLDNDSPHYYRSFVHSKSLCRHKKHILV